MKSPYKGEFRVTQTYRGADHQGLDLVGVADKGIYATVAGVVEVAGNADPNGFGIYVRIKEDGTGHRYYYGHLSSAAVRAGQRVSPGDRLGTEGSTGRSTGSHCHYEVRKNLSHGSFLDVSALSGIPNKLGRYHQGAGWVKEGGKWYYLTAGERQTGWINDGGRWYFLGPDGAMRTGWVKDAGRWYLLANSGAMRTGWAKDGGYWYYLGPDGAMQTGWLSEKDQRYYLRPSGEMVTGAYPIDGVWYGFDRSGALCRDGKLTVRTDGEGRITG